MSRLCRYVQQAAEGGKDQVMGTAITRKRGPDGWRIAAIRNRLPAARVSGDALKDRSAMRPIIRLLGPDDASVLDNVAPGVFDNAIDPRWTAEFLSDPRHHLAVAIDEGRVVGMASAFHHVHPDRAPISGSARSQLPRRTRDGGSAAG